MGFRLAVAVLVLALSAGDIACAQQADPAPGEVPVLLQADQVTWDEELGVVTASGNVEIARGDRVLKADTISYNQRAGTVTASGNVSITGAGGDVVFAEYVELKDDLREGVVQNLGLLLADRARLAAAAARRSGGNRTDFDKVVYSPCALCPEDPTRAPLWQIKAVRVIHDEDENTITFKDAWLEFFGVPVLYTPWFEIPDPTVERQSGLLAPGFGYTRNLGLYTRVPYYWSIAPDKDFTFEPMIATDVYPVAYGEYRQRFTDGSLRLAGSGTYGLREGEGNEFRGHVDGSARYDIDENWRAGLDLRRATDKEYLRVYNYPDDRTLTSRLFAEGFWGRDYAVLQGYSFQGTRDIDDNGEQPWLFPWGRYSWVGEPASYGGYFSFDTDALVLTRAEGREYRRASVGGGWTLPWVSPLGDVYKLTANLRGDIYSFDGVDPNSNDVNPGGPTESGVEARIYPQLALDWSYPFVRDHGTMTEILEPVIAISVAPNDLNPGEIANEDSLDLVFEETNLFEANRSPGLDLVDDGQRITYGFRWKLVGDDISAGLTLGQSLQFNGDDQLSQASGVDDNLSDLVGAAEFAWSDMVDVSYRFQFDTEDLELQRNELRLQAGVPEARLTLAYSWLAAEASPNATFGDREEVYGVLTSQFDANWSGHLLGRYDIESNKPLLFGGGVRYQDECFIIQPAVYFNNFEDQEVLPGVTARLSITFRNLGAYDFAY